MDFAFDVIVVGGGHAGCEAAAAAAKLGSKTLLVTLDMAKMAQMSCNPAIGGIAKGQIVREIDALGGLTAIVTDKTSIQFRMLNRSKGPAMWSPRAQCDRTQFSVEWRKALEKIENLFFWQDSVVGLLTDQNKVIGVYTALGQRIFSKTVVLTNGTFLNGLIHVGKAQVSGGRAGELASTGLSESLLNMGFDVGRMKTGTPMRIDARSVNFSLLTEQKGDELPEKFSFSWGSNPVSAQLSCYTVYTNKSVHSVLESKFSESPLFNGTIKSIGPRYCPSIEDKVRTFHDKEQHQLFLEPEGRNNIEYYLNGFSSSLPFEVQLEALKKIPGFENVRVFRPGYAIEYDFFQPTQLNHSLETKLISGLFFAGQINGTTGYEEAAAQGLLAGINAHRLCAGLDPVVLSRDEAYIGVLIDDLVTKGVDEPYRMFTSRAEFRILLRQDNADERLTPLGYAIGLISIDRYNEFKRKMDLINRGLDLIHKSSIPPFLINPVLRQRGGAETPQARKAAEFLVRPEVGIDDIFPLLDEFSVFKNDCGKLYTEVSQAIEIKIKYSGYIERERIVAGKLKRLEHVRINPDFDFSQLTSISTEARQKLMKIRPADIGQASRIPGVSPSDINVLLIYFGR